MICASSVLEGVWRGLWSFRNHRGAYGHIKKLSWRFLKQKEKKTEQKRVLSNQFCRWKWATVEETTSAMVQCLQSCFVYSVADKGEAPSVELLGNYSTLNLLCNHSIIAYNWSKFSVCFVHSTRMWVIVWIEYCKSFRMYRPYYTCGTTIT